MTPSLANTPLRAIDPRILIVAAGFAARAWLAFLPEHELVTRLLPDDAFYYLQIARNIAAGNGVSFDGSVTTNGFHPLWMLVVTACYAPPLPDAASLRLALVASAAIGAAGVLPVHAMLLRHAQSENIARLGAALYALSPPLIVMTINGLETAIVVTALLFCVDAFDRAGGGEPRAWFATGVAGGTLMLARTDYAIVLSALLLMLALRSGYGVALRSGVLAAAFVLPWVAWSYFAEGSVLQSSGQAVPIVAHGNGPDGFEAVTHGLGGFRDAWLRQIPEWYIAGPALRLAGVALLAGSAVIAAVFVAQRRTIGWTLIALGCGLVALTFAHTALRWYFREWYAVPVIPLVLIAFVAAIASLSGRARFAAGTAFTVVWCVCSISFVLHEARDPQYEIQADMLAAARWIEGNTAETATVGSVNAGIVGYYGSRETVNLDGVVDGDALEAIGDHRLLEYAIDRCVAYIAEFPFYLFFYDRYWGNDIGEHLTIAAEFRESIERQPPSIANAFTVWRFAPLAPDCPSPAAEPR